MKEEDLAQLKREITSYYQQKYGDVTVSIDELTPEGEQSARVQVTLSDARGFITRHYGSVAYKEQELALQTMGI